MSIGLLCKSFVLFVCLFCFVFHNYSLTFDENGEKACFEYDMCLIYEILCCVLCIIFYDMLLGLTQNV